MYNTLMIIFWSLTYAAIVVYSFVFRRERKVFMPLVAGSLNFAWELLALIQSNGYWGHVVWLILDIFIIGYNVWILEQWRKRILYLALTAIFVVLLYLVFRLKNTDGMLLSSFVIDLIMAFEFVMAMERLSPHGKVAIGSFRLLGDLFAWLANLSYSKVVLGIGIAVLVFNLFYLGYCFVEYFRLHKKIENGKRNNV